MVTPGMATPGLPPGAFHIDKDSLFCYSCGCHGKGNAARK